MTGIFKLKVSKRSKTWIQVGKGTDIEISNHSTPFISVRDELRRWIEPKAN